MRTRPSRPGKHSPGSAASAGQAGAEPQLPAEIPPPFDRIAAQTLSAPSGDWFWLQDAQLRLIHLSEQGVPQGVNLAPYLGAKRFEQPTLNLDQHQWERHRNQIERREPFTGLEIECFADDGRIVWLSLSGRPLHDERGEFIGYLGAGRDITAEKRSRQLLALQHSVARTLSLATEQGEAIRRVLKAIGESEHWDCADFWQLDESEQALRRSEQWVAPGSMQPVGEEGRSATIALKAGGRLPAAVWQAGTPRWIADAMTDTGALAHLRAAETGLRTVVFQPVGAGGRTLGMLEFSSRAVRAPDEAMQESLGIVAAQLALALQGALASPRAVDDPLRVLARSGFEWYWEMDISGVITAVERSVASEEQDPARQLIGWRFWETKLETEGGWEKYRALVESGQPLRDLVVWRRLPGGRKCFAYVTGIPLFAKNGKCTAYRGVARDITRQRREEQLLHLELQVCRLLAAAGDTLEGLKSVVLALCESEGWDTGRFFRVDAASGTLQFVSGWCSSKPVIERLVDRNRNRWAAGGIAISEDPSPAPSVSSFVIGVASDGRTIGALAFSGQGAPAPDEALQRAAESIGSRIGQFMVRKQAEESLRASEARYRSLSHIASDFLWETDAQHRLTRIARRPDYTGAEVLYGVIGKAPWEVASVTPDETGWTAHRRVLESLTAFRDFELSRAMPGGGVRYFLISGEPNIAADGTFLGYRGIGRDITEGALTRERFAQLAYRDPLTGVANRTGLTAALEHAVERARRHGSKLAGVFIDLDGFKELNDAYGHDAGDRCLIEVARRLRENVRASDIIARIGGDEFFVLLDEVQDEAAAQAVVSKLLDKTSKRCVLPEGQYLELSLSMGVSLFPDNSPDAAALIKHADIAMYCAKQAGKNGYCMYSNQRSLPAFGSAREG